MASSATYGAKSPESIAFHIAVYETIQSVPYGHVTSYGHIAYLVGAPEKSRHVGFALKHLPTVSLAEDRGTLPDEPQLPEFNVNNVPWWRIINSQGKISLVAERKQRQIERLQQENIEVDPETGAVAFSEYGWFPEEI